MKGFNIGDTASCTRTFTDLDKQLYLQISGEEEGFRADGFTPLPEPLIGGLFSFLLGTKLPGFGTNYLKQKMQFTGQAYYGEPLTATVKITRLRPDKELVNLETKCINSGGKQICIGEALVLAKNVEPPIRGNNNR